MVTTFGRGTGDITMKKYFIATITLLVGLAINLGFSSCKRINAGYEGVLVNLYGSDDGVNDVSYVYGIVWYNPLEQCVYEYPTFVQTIHYPAFTVYSKDGSEFTINPTISMKMVKGQAAPIFRKYRKELLLDIMAGPLFEHVKDAYRQQVCKLTTNEIISKRDSFETAVKEQVATTLNKEGFHLEQLTSGLKYPSNYCRGCH